MLVQLVNNVTKIPKDFSYFDRPCLVQWLLLLIFVSHGYKMVARAPDNLQLEGRKKDVGGAEAFSE